MLSSCGNNGRASASPDVHRSSFATYYAKVLKLYLEDNVCGPSKSPVSLGGLGYRAGLLLCDKSNFECVILFNVWIS